MTMLREAWARLHLDGSHEAGYVRLRITSHEECPIYAARRVDDGLELLMIEVDTRSLPPKVKYPAARGFSVEPTVLVAGQRGRTRLHLQLSESKYRDVFEALCEDVLRAMTTTSDEGRAVCLMVDRLGRWQAFLGRHGSDLLSKEARRGLFGELWFLRERLMNSDGIERAIGYWAGPSGANQDFHLPCGVVEVKTTSASDPHEIRISNVRQLDPCDSPRLILFLLQVDENEVNGIALPDLVDSVRNDLGGEAIDLFENKLLAVGYLDIHSEHYLRPRYLIIRERCFEVKDGFPRILPADLPRGVMDVSYSIAVTSCENHGITCDSVGDLLDEVHQ